MVEKLICYFEDINHSMDKKKSPFTRTGSSKSLRGNSTSKVKKLVNEFTEIKRPHGKAKLQTENSELSEKSKTLPKGSKVSENELTKMHSKITKNTTKKNSKQKEANSFNKKENKGQHKTETDLNKKVNSEHVPEIEKKVEEFGEQLKQKRTKQNHISRVEKNIVPNEPQINKKQNVSFKGQTSLEEHSEIESSDTEEDKSCSTFNELDSDDMFGSNDFDENCNDNYIVETYNKEGKELIIVTLEITRKSISLSEREDDINELVYNSDFVFYENTVSPKNLNNLIETNSVEEDQNEAFSTHTEEQKEELDDNIKNYEEEEEIYQNGFFSPDTDELVEEEHIYQDGSFSTDIGQADETDEISYLDEPSSSNNQSVHQSSDSDIYEEINDSDDRELHETSSILSQDYANETVFTYEEKSEHMSSRFIRNHYRYHSERELGDNFFHNSLDSSDNEEFNIKKVEKKDKISFVIEEMIKTEELYIASMKIVVEKYLPYMDRHTSADLLGKTSYLFGNIEKIYKGAQEFLQLLKQNGETADGVAKVFIKSASIFDLYPQYSKNKPTADLYLKEFDELVKKKERQLEDKLGLASHLLTPIQRLGKYILMLENIQKELKKTGRSLDSVNKAITIIRRAMRKGNDSIAIDSIKNCKIDLSFQGSFIMRANFNILKPRKIASMVFLFENVIVFTQKVAKNMEQFNYIDSIQMSDLSLGKFEEKPYIFHLTDYPKFKKANHDAVTYVLEAETPKIKNEWTVAIEAKLWVQLQTAKEQQKQLNFDEGKRFSKVSLPRSPIIRRHSSKIKKVSKPRSTFYDDQSNV